MRTVLCSVLTMLVTIPLLAGCPCRASRTYPAPTTTSLLGILAKRDQQVRTLRLKAKVDQWTKQGRIKVRVYILTTAAGKLRFEAVSPFDTSLVTLTSDGKQFASIDHKNHVYYSGPAKPCNIARVFGLALEPREVGRALGGGAPVIAHDKASVTWSRCEGAEVLRLEDSAKKLVQRIWMQNKGGLWKVLKSTVSTSKGKLLVRLEFDQWKRIQGALVPRTIKFRQTQPHADVIIRYHKREVNVEIPDDAFQLKAPAGLPERILTCP